MARITGIPSDTRNPLLRLVFWLVRRKVGRDVAPLRGYATSGAVLASTVALELGMERARRLDGRLKQLAELRVAALVGCPFCLDIGTALVRRAGVAEEKLRALNDHGASTAFSPLEKLVLAYADRMTATPVEVTDADVAALRAHLDEAQLVELTAAIAHENLRGRINHALGYGAEGFSAGAYCVRPAGRPADRTLPSVA
jgi:AhpD family alkylhydroperoxidase